MLISGSVYIYIYIYIYTSSHGIPPWGKQPGDVYDDFFSFLWDSELPYFQPLVGNLVGANLMWEIPWFGKLVFVMGKNKVFKMGNHGTSKVMSREFC